MSNSFLKHIQNYVDAPPLRSMPTPQQFSTTEELLELPDVKRFSSYPDFDYFAKSNGLLMAVFKDRSWVVGYLENLDGVDLPLWKRE